MEETSFAEKTPGSLFNARLDKNSETAKRGLKNVKINTIKGVKI